METMALGMFAVSVLILSGICMYYKKPFIGFVSSIAAMALTCLTGYSWKLMLIDSGKDTTLLGFSRYPAALIILAALMLTAFIMMIVSGILILQRSKNKSGKY